MTNMARLILIAVLLIGRYAAQAQYVTRPDTWVAVDALGRTVGEGTYPRLRTDRKVGIFYFVWQGAHGYDRSTRMIPDQGVIPVLPADTLSPYDISRMLRENPENPQYGPVGAFHYWGEPYLGYYLSDDEWVIRKHAQMLSDANVDVIMIDATNAFTYLPQVTLICETYRRMRQQGSRTPEIAFVINSKPLPTLDRLYGLFYKEGLYSELWFRWKGRPLVLCPPEGVTDETAAFFTVRHAWFNSGRPWFGDGHDKWTWGDIYPQRYGWHEDPAVPEEVSVCVATHPTVNIGRSFHEGKQPQPNDFRSGEGLYFSEQFGRALEIDPEFIFITGWNEWVAQRFTDGKSTHMLGKKIEIGDTYFVDQYDEEYSRDIEPMRGGFGDNYYYQTVEFIRRYKGVPEPPLYRRGGKIKFDGSMSEWKKIPAVWYDDKDDTFPRMHRGWGSVGVYSDSTGRNDITETRVVCDDHNVYFYVRTADVLSDPSGLAWMMLFISVGDHQEPTWEGFQYVVNRVSPDGGTAFLEKSTGGWNWMPHGKLLIAVKGSEMEIRVPLELLGFGADSFSMGFKWIDNAAAHGDIIECIDKGDTAPNGRFRYRFDCR